MKLFVGVAFVAISFVFVTTAGATPDNSSRQMTNLEDVGVVSMVDDVALPIHVSMEIQKDNHGYAVTEAKALNTRGKTTYQLRVSRDTSNSPGGKYIMYDEDWEAVREISVLQQDSSPRPSTENKDEEEEEGEENATDQEASEATIRSMDRPKPDEDVDNDDASDEVEPHDDATNDDADEDEDDEAVNQPDTVNEDPG